MWQNLRKSLKTDKKEASDLISWSPVRLSFLVNFSQPANPTGLLVREKNSFFLSPPSSQFPLGNLIKNPSIPYSQKTWIPGLRECVGVIIPSPGTINIDLLGSYTPWQWYFVDSLFLYPFALGGPLGWIPAEKPAVSGGDLGQPFGPQVSVV